MASPEASKRALSLPSEPHPIAARAAELLIRQEGRGLELPPAGAEALKVMLAGIVEQPEALLHAVASLGVLILWLRDQGAAGAADALAELTSESTTGPMLLQTALLHGDAQAERSGVIAKLLGRRKPSAPRGGDSGKPAWTLGPVSAMPRRV